MRTEGETEICFGDCGRRIHVESSTSPSLLDEDGHAFTITQAPAAGIAIPKGKRRLARTRHDRFVRAAETVIIPPETSKQVPVKAYFPPNTTSLLVERQIISNKNEDEVFGMGNTLIDRDTPVLHVANFTKSPLVIPIGEVLGASPSADGDQRFNALKKMSVSTHNDLQQSTTVYLHWRGRQRQTWGAESGLHQPKRQWWHPGLWYCRQAFDQ